MNPTVFGSRNNFAGRIVVVANADVRLDVFCSRCGFETLRLILQEVAT